MAYATGQRHPQYRHGMYGTPLYNRWCGMKRRCLNPNERCYYLYGGRGITVCDKWMSFEGFMEDMGDTFTEDASLERVDNEKGYCKENCKWIPPSDQSKNRRCVKKYEHNGESHSIAEWARRTGIKKSTLRYRLKVLGWSVEKAVTKAVHLGNRWH